jgi:1-deoxy-D-xylulose-5-phosphate reductoisomerase
MKRIAILGSTGSIGTNCLDVAESLSDEFTVTCLTAHRRWEELSAQCRRFRPRWAVLADESVSTEAGAADFGASTSLLFGPEHLSRVASHPDVDVVVAAIVGAAGLESTWSALEAGKRVALANKETLVIAGPLVRGLLERSGGSLIPVDSEHSGVFQALQAGRSVDVRRVVLTASGGPFRNRPRERFADITPAEALAHPTWQMGPKITVDSATMMNKALEVIEARWLFDLEVDQIEVVVHPQSIVHAMVEFVDGSTILQASPPDMRLPIQYALTWPERAPGISPQLDLTSALTLEFEPADDDRFPALALGFEVARSGGTSGAVLNAANEVAVQRFLDGTLRFTEIPEACRDVLEAHNHDASPGLDELLQSDRWAREEMNRWTSLPSHSCLN